MSELIRISRKAANAWKNTDGYSQAAVLIDLLCDQLEQAVPVVRCKDCKYHKDTSVKMYAHCCLIGQTVSKDDFCSQGERRDDNA